MANQLSDWIDYLVAQLKVSFPSAEVMRGRRQGVSRDKDRINVFAAGPWQTDPARAVVARQPVAVRYWKRHSEQPPTDTDATGADPTELEQAKLDLLDALRPLQTLTAIAGRRPWYFLVRTAEIDDDPAEWGVQVVLEGVTANEGVIA